MCHYVGAMQSLIPHFMGKFLSEIFQGLRAAPGMSYGEIMVGHCLGCKRPLSYQEMFPPGRCPRSMCEHCYNSVIASIPNYRCIITGTPLSQAQVNNQRVNQRELRNYIANDFPSAWDLFLVLSNKVLGTNMTFLKDDQVSQQYQQLQRPAGIAIPLPNNGLHRYPQLEEIPGRPVEMQERTFNGKEVVYLD